VSFFSFRRQLHKLPCTVHGLIVLEKIVRSIFWPILRQGQVLSSRAPATLNRKFRTLINMITILSHPDNNMKLLRYWISIFPSNGRDEVLAWHFGYFHGAKCIKGCAWRLMFDVVRGKRKGWTAWGSLVCACVWLCLNGFGFEINLIQQIESSLGYSQCCPLNYISPSNL
jgi:hypothetical protein